jgi:hypothetical protein
MRPASSTEAQAVAHLRHPHIVAIHEVGQSGGQPFFSLELVEGGNLGQQLAEAALPPPQAALLVETLARAVQAAHEAGLVHRDLKPANVLVTAEGTPKITDFGLAKFLGSDSGRTQTGAILGTPSYMAPEQAQGEGRGGGVGPAADVWALGAILYECLTGRPPFRGPTVLETLEQVLTQEPVPLSRLQPRTPRDLETIALKCLHKEAGRRYGSAGELAADLGRFLAGEPIRARRVGVLERGGKWARRRPAHAALAATLVLAVCGALGGALVFARNAEANAREQGRLRQEAEDAAAREKDHAAKEKELRQEADAKQKEAAANEKKALAAAATVRKHSLREHFSDPFGPRLPLGRVVRDRVPRGLPEVQGGGRPPPSVLQARQGARVP